MPESKSTPQTNPGESSSASVVRRQWTLRGMLLGMTYCSVASAIAARFGLGWFVLLTGLLLTWLSFRGYLWRWQTPPMRPIAFGSAWSLFVISMFLPVVTFTACGGKPTTVYGWEVASSAFDIAELNQPNEFLQYALNNLPNLLMVSSPLLWLAWAYQRGRHAGAIYYAAAFISWLWSAGDTELQIGYYVWSASVTLIALARPPTWVAWSLIGLIAFGLTIFILVLR